MRLLFDALLAAADTAERLAAAFAPLGWLLSFLTKLRQQWHDRKRALLLAARQVFATAEYSLPPAAAPSAAADAAPTPQTPRGASYLPGALDSSQLDERGHLLEHVAQNLELYLANGRPADIGGWREVEVSPRVPPPLHGPFP